MSLSVIEEAIANKYSISFEYTRPGKTVGTRYGDPHAAFIRRMKADGEERVYLHLWQTGGVTDSKEDIPGWRQFFLNELTNVQINPDKIKFQPATGYNPSSYEFPIIKI